MKITMTYKGPNDWFDIECVTAQVRLKRLVSHEFSATPADWVHILQAKDILGEDLELDPSDGYKSIRPAVPDCDTNLVCKDADSSLLPDNVADGASCLSEENKLYKKIDGEWHTIS